MADKFLEFRLACRRIYQKLQGFIEFIFKFGIAFFAYDQITDSLPFAQILSEPVLKVVFGLVGAFLPPIAAVLLCAVIAIYEIFTAAPLLAAAVLVIFIIVYCFAARFSGKNAFAVAAVPILFKFNLHYIVALVLGLTAGPLSFIPAVCGVIYYYVLKVTVVFVPDAHVRKADEILALYTGYLQKLIEVKEIVAVSAVFAVVIIVMWLIRKLRFPFVFEITIVIGGLLTILGFMVSNDRLGTNFDTKNVVIGTVISIAMVMVVQFFRTVLDYMAVESVQFEDDDYYYYVKAVPKLSDHRVSREERLQERAAILAAEREERARNEERIMGSEDDEAPVTNHGGQHIAIAPADDSDKYNVKDEITENPTKFTGDVEDDFDNEIDNTNMDFAESSVYNMVFSGLNKKQNNRMNRDNKEGKIKDKPEE